MSIEALKDALPAYAKDLKLHLSSLASETLLTEQQRAGTFIACALASRERSVTNAIMSEFAPRLSPEALTAARAAASIMGMNNIYYRFTHLASAPDYKTRSWPFGGADPGRRAHRRHRARRRRHTGRRSP